MENVVGPDSLLGVLTPPCRWVKLRFLPYHTVWYGTPSSLFHTTSRKSYWGKPVHMPVEQKLLFATWVMQESSLFSVLGIFSGEEMPWVMHQSAIIFQSKNTVYHCVYQGAGQELNYNTFFRSKHKSTNHMPVKLLMKTNGVACSTINPLSRCHCWSVLEKPES